MARCLLENYPKNGVCSICYSATCGHGSGGILQNIHILSQTAIAGSPFSYFPITQQRYEGVKYLIEVLC